MKLFARCQRRDKNVLHQIFRSMAVTHSHQCEAEKLVAVLTDPGFWIAPAMSDIRFDQFQGILCGGMKLMLGVQAPKKLNHIGARRGLENIERARGLRTARRMEHVLESGD